MFSGWEELVVNSSMSSFEHDATTHPKMASSQKQTVSHVFGHLKSSYVHLSRRKTLVFLQTKVTTKLIIQSEKILYFAGFDVQT